MLCPPGLVLLMFTVAFCCNISVGAFPFLRIKSKKKCNNTQDEKDSSSASLIFVSLVLSAIRFATLVLSVICNDFISAYWLVKENMPQFCLLPAVVLSTHMPICVRAHMVDMIFQPLLSLDGQLQLILKDHLKPSCFKQNLLHDSCMFIERMSCLWGTHCQTCLSSVARCATRQINHFDSDGD